MLPYTSLTCAAQPPGDPRRRFEKPHELLDQSVQNEGKEVHRGRGEVKIAGRRVELKPSSCSIHVYKMKEVTKAEAQSWPNQAFLLVVLFSCDNLCEGMVTMAYPEK
eukprot:1158592-Pelagomonas_calceolata.AAC.6